ncbi:MAG: GtrA family protein [Candidatus Nomurabacteria bacterium]|jgi:putative flippase GtrA|nr:GtrA family protein [Candidatus Nomurabacteria bacterium]
MKTHKRIGIFALVGIFNTLFDYILFMIFANFLGNVVASIVSATFAMIISFFLHKKYTWGDRKTSRASMLQFLVSTATVMWGVRPFAIWGLTAASTSFMAPLYGFAHFILSFLSYEFVVRTGIFAIATLFTLTINYIIYNKFIFRQHKDPAEKEPSDASSKTN